MSAGGPRAGPASSPRGNSRHSRESPSASTAGFPPGASPRPPGQRPPCLPVPAAERTRSPGLSVTGSRGEGPDPGAAVTGAPGPPPSGARPHPTCHHHRSAGQEAEPTVHRAHSAGPRSYRAGLAMAWAHPFQALNPWSPDTWSISRRLRGVAPKATSQSSPRGRSSLASPAGP